MSKRRANGEGAVYQRADGSWECKISVAGKRMSFYAPTAKAATMKANKARQRVAAHQPIKDSTMVVGDWMAHWRATTLAASDRKESTRSWYANMSKHIEAEPFGSIQLDKMKPSDVEKLILDLRANGLSDSTVRGVYTTLRAGLDGAVRDELMARNPCHLVRRPGVERHEARCLTAAEVLAVLKAAETSRYHTALMLIAATGLRRGEAAALHWPDVDLDAGVLKVVFTLNRVGNKLVFSEPKTERSRRIIPLPPLIVALLKKHRTAQKEDRLRAGNQWRENNLVFPTEFGTSVDPRSLLRVVEAAAKKAGVEDVGVHTLRHSAATAWLEGGVDIKTIADTLGHSSIAITGDTYLHANSDAAARAAVDGLAERLGL